MEIHEITEEDWNSLLAEFDRRRTIAEWEEFTQSWVEHETDIESAVWQLERSVAFHYY